MLRMVPQHIQRKKKMVELSPTMARLVSAADGAADAHAAVVAVLDILIRPNTEDEIKDSTVMINQLATTIATQVWGLDDMSSMAKEDLDEMVEFFTVTKIPLTTAALLYSLAKAG